MPPPKTINPGKSKGFKYLINCIQDKHDVFTDKPKYALLIGAGCSYKSNIPLGGGVIDICQKLSYLKNEVAGSVSLIKAFLEKGDIKIINNFLENEEHLEVLKKYIDEKHQTLKQRVLSDRQIEEKKLKEFIFEALWDDYEDSIAEDAQYGFWMDEFDNSPKERQRLIESLIEHKDPGGAYILLAYMIERKVFTNILTTNFDDLINDALMYFTGTRCRFYADDEISQFISVYSDKPNIIKLHGDYRFANMKNTSKETVQLSTNLELKIGELLQNFNVVVVGYNGADHSIMNALNKIKRNSKYELIWCGMSDQDVHWRVAQLINNTDNSYFVKIEGFDEMMGQLYPHFKKSEPPNLEMKAKERQKIVDTLLLQFKAEFNESSVSENSKAAFNQSNYIDNLFKKAYDEKDMDKAIVLYDELLSIDNKNAPAFNNRGVIWYDKKEYEKALEDYNTAIELDPKYVMAYNNRGLVYEANKQYDKSIEDYNKAIDLDPKYATAYSNRGLVYEAYKEYDKAIEDYSKAIELDPRFAFPYNNRGIAWENKKDMDRAIEDYSKAIEVDPTFTLAYSNRGNVYAAKGLYDKAIEDYDKGLKYNDSDFIIYSDRGKAYLKMDLPEKALNDFETAYRLNPEDSKYINATAHAYRILKNYDAALKTIQEGIAKFPNEGILYCTIAEIFAAQNDEEGFYASIEKALKLDFAVGDFLDDAVYAKYKDEQRFADLLAKYKKDV